MQYADWVVNTAMLMEGDGSRACEMKLELVEMVVMPLPVGAGELRMARWNREAAGVGCDFHA